MQISSFLEGIMNQGTRCLHGAFPGGAFIRRYPEKPLFLKALAGFLFFCLFLPPSFVSAGRDISVENDGPGTPYEIQTMQDAMRRFEEAANTFRSEVQLLVEWKYEERRNYLIEKYEEAITGIEAEERERRLKAIERFEAFIAKYPSEPGYTPDALMRLAELHYEKIEDEHRLKELQYYAYLEEGAEGEDLPSPPVRRFERPIELYQRVVTFFPQYRYGDAAYYLLGYLLIQQDEFDSALLTFDNLIRRYPQSRFIPEVRMRIGEYYFDADQALIPDALELAIESYTKALEYRDHHLYDKVLYKLAWTYYRVHDYDNAVNYFLDLLAIYQEEAEEEGLEEVGGDLREEAIQYAAASFADDDWGGFGKALSFMGARGNPEYEFDVLRRLGEIFFDITRHRESVEVLKHVLSRYPHHRDAPVIQERIVRAWERERDFPRAFEEQQILVANYTRGSTWHSLYRNDPEAMERAEEITERSLYVTAIFHFEQAQTYRAEGDVALAIREYQRAASSIARYLELHPHTSHLYDLEFYLADAFFWTGNFSDAAYYFESVRDSSLDDEYLDQAALGAVESYEREIVSLEETGSLPARETVTSVEWPEGLAVEPIDLPDIYEKFVNASDVFVKLFPDNERSPGIAYDAGLAFYRHNQHDEARRRFEEIVERWPLTEAASYAANLIIETLLIAQDWGAVEQTSERLLASEALSDVGGEVKETFIQFKLGGRFRRAQEFMDEEEFEKAAELFLNLVDEAPDHEFADRALFNAAVCQEESLRFETALATYERLYREYPDSDLADRVLFMVALNAQKAFDYERAISRYLLLTEEYPDSEQHESALYNAAILTYYIQKYDEAARLFHRFASSYPQSTDTPRMLLRAADAQEKQGNSRGAISSYQEFIRRYRNNPDAASQIVEARLQIARAYARLGNQRAALQSYRDTVSEFNRLGLASDDPAVLHAAEAQFMIAEAAFEEYDSMAIEGTGRGARLERSFANAFTRKMDKAVEVQGLYEDVYNYPHPEYVLAAAYRLGHVLERFAQALFDAPVPDEVTRQGEEFVWAYQAQLADAAIPLEDQAVELYIAAAERARRLGIVNEWSRRTMESLSRYRPDEYPVLKEARDSMADRLLTPVGMAPTVFGVPEPASTGTVLDDEDEDVQMDFGPVGFYLPGFSSSVNCFVSSLPKECNMSEAGEIQSLDEGGEGTS